MSETINDNICENSKAFDSLKTVVVGEDTKSDLNEANILYNNAKFYYTTGEFNGALVSYSCSAVLLNSLIRKLKQLGLSDEANLKAVNDATKILNCCLSAVQELQGKVKKMSTGGSKGAGKDEEKKDWQKICTNLQPLVFKDGSSDCLFFDDVAGLKKEKELLKSSLIYPLSYPNLYPKTAKGILIYGPPGTGKTYIVKAAVNELQKTDPNIAVLFFAPSPGDLKGKYVGETEKKIEEWFTCASKAACDAQLDCKEKKQYISIMFMDEFDAIGPDRSQDSSGFAANSVNTLLQMMDGIASKKNVTVVAATNFPWSLDSAILRRFDTQILISLPSKSDINQVLDIEMKKIIKLKDDPDTDAYCRSERKLLTNVDSADKGKDGKDKVENDICSNNGCTKTSQKNIINEAPYNQMVYDFYDQANSAFFTGYVSNLQEKHYSNSDVTRLVKSAATYTGQLAISNNLFYSTDTILNYKLDTPKYISSLTKLKDTNLGFKLSVNTLNSYLGIGETPSNIYEITSPEIVQIIYNEKKYVNVKCLFYKNNDLLINDVKIKDIYIEFEGEVNEANYKKMYNKPIDESRDVIISYNFAMKEKDNVQNFEQRSILPISKKLIEIVFQPIYEAIKVVNTNIQTLEMIDSSVSDLEQRKTKLEDKQKEYMDIKRKLGTTNDNALNCIKKFMIDDVLKIINDILKTEVTNVATDKNGVIAAKKYALDMFGIQDSDYTNFKKTIEENEIFNINSTSFFNLYLKKILENPDIFFGITSSILTRTKKDNILKNNYYDFYNYLLLYKISLGNPDIIQQNNFKDTFNNFINLYLSSLKNYDKVALININAANLVVETFKITANLQQINTIKDEIGDNLTKLTEINEKFKAINENFKPLLETPEAAEAAGDITQKIVLNKFNSLPKVHTIFLNFKNNLRLPVYLIEYYNKSNEDNVKNNEILIDIKQYINFITEFDLINKLQFLNKENIDKQDKLYVKIEVDFFIEIFNKYINIRQFIINYNEIITKNQKKLDKDFEKFNNNNFTQVDQQLIQIYLNDIFNFCKLIDRMDIPDDTTATPATSPIGTTSIVVPPPPPPNTLNPPNTTSIVVPPPPPNTLNPPNTTSSALPSANLGTSSIVNPPGNLSRTSTSNSGTPPSSSALPSANLGSSTNNSPPPTSSALPSATTTGNTPPTTASLNATGNTPPGTSTSKVGGAPDDKPKIKEHILQEYFKKMLDLGGNLNTINLLEIICIRIQNNYDFVHFEKICVFDKYWDKKSFVAIDYKVFNTPKTKDAAIVAKSVTAINSLMTGEPVKVATTATAAPNATVNTANATASATTSATTSARPITIVNAPAKKESFFKNPSASSTTENPSSSSAVNSSHNEQLDTRGIKGRLQSLKRGGGKSLKHLKKHKTFSKNKSLKKIYRGGQHSDTYNKTIEFITTDPDSYTEKYKDGVKTQFTIAINEEISSRAPELIETYTKFGDYLKNIGENAQAKENYQKGLVLNPNDSYLTSEIARLTEPSRIPSTQGPPPRTPSSSLSRTPSQTSSTQGPPPRTTSTSLNQPDSTASVASASVASASVAPPVETAVKTEAEVAAEVAAIFTQGDNLMNEKKYTEARTEYEKVNSITAATEEHKTELAAKLVALDAAILNTQQEIQTQISTIFTEGDKLMNEKKYGNARTEYEKVNSISGATEANKTNLAAKLTAIDAAILFDINKIFAEGDLLKTSLNYADARAKYNEVNNITGLTEANKQALTAKIAALDAVIIAEIEKETKEALTKKSKYLAGLIKLKGEFGADSEKILKTAIVKAKPIGETSDPYINAINNLGYFYRLKIDFVKAEEQYKIALQACEKKLTDDNKRKANINDTIMFETINNLGVLYFDLGVLETQKNLKTAAYLKYKKAMYLFKRNFFVYQDNIADASKWNDNNNLNYALIIFYIAETLSAMGKKNEAWVMYSKSKEILDKITVSNVAENMKSTFNTLQDIVPSRINEKDKPKDGLDFGKVVQSFIASYESEAKDIEKEEKDQDDVKKYVEAVEGQSSNIYNKIELYGFIGFCTGFGENDITKKIANKTIFVKTILDLKKFKDASEKGGIWHYFKSHMSSYGDMIKSLFSNKTADEQKKSKTDNILMEITKKNLLSSLFINNISALGFLLHNNNANIVDDSIIINSGNTASTIRWIDITEGSGFYKASSGAITSTQKAIGTYGLEGILAGLGLMVAGAGAGAAAAGTGAVVAGTGAVVAGTGAVAATSAVAATGAVVATGITAAAVGWILVGVGAVVLVGAEIKAYGTKVDDKAVLTNLLAKYIYTIITEGSIDVVNLDGVDPTQAFINQLCELISILNEGFFKRNLIKTSRRVTYNYQEANLIEIDKDQKAVFSKKNVNKLAIDKKLLTNLNIPVKSFAHALMEVKSTDVKENRLKLEEYFENKDAVLEKLKKEREKR